MVQKQREGNRHSSVVHSVNQKVHLPVLPAGGTRRPTRGNALPHADNDQDDDGQREEDADDVGQGPAGELDARHVTGEQEPVRGPVAARPVEQQRGVVHCGDGLVVVASDRRHGDRGDGVEGRVGRRRDGRRRGRWAAWPFARG